MARKVGNKRVTLDVTPDMLPLIGSMMPGGFFIAGSRDAEGGVVRLLLEGAAVETDGEHMELIIRSEGHERLVSLQPAGMTRRRRRQSA